MRVIENNLISCEEHIDTNFDMICDNCEAKMPIENYLEKGTLEDIAENDSKVKVSGNMLKGSVLKTNLINQNEAIELARKHMPNLTSGDVLCGYNITLSSNGVEYQVGDFNQEVMVNISDLDLEINNTVAFLHIIDEDTYEIIPIDEIFENEINFKATRFSPYILIYVDKYTVTFSGDSNYKILDEAGKEFVSGDTILEGTDLNFVVLPEDGYIVSEVVLDDEESGDNYIQVSDDVFGKTIKINNIYKSLQINVSTISADDALNQVDRFNYDSVNKDTEKPLIDNVNVEPNSGRIGTKSEIVITFNITDKNYDYLNGSLLYPEDIKVLVDGLEAITATKKLTKANIPNGERFTLEITNIWGEGNLSIKIPEGKITDLAFNKNDEYVIDTEIEVSRNLLSEVTNFRATSGDSENSITITWTDAKNEGDVKYVLEARNQNNDWVVLKNGATSPYVHGSLSKNMSFEYRIKVVDTALNESEYVYTIGRTEYDSIFGDVMIDTIKPIIELKGKNPDVSYIGATQEVMLIFESFDENYNSDMTKLTVDNFIINVGGSGNIEVNKTLTKEKTSKGERFRLTLSNLTGNGKLEIEIPAGVIIDSALNQNDETNIDTGIIVVNGETATKDAPTLIPDIHTISVTTNQTSIIPMEKIIYEYRVSGDGTFTKIESIEKNILIQGLYSNTEYEVRTTIIDVAGNSTTSNSAYTKTLKLDSSKIVIDHETKEWTNLIEPNPKVIATINWNDDAYIHEYSLDNNNWTRVTENITNINISNNVTIYARYSDGVGHSDTVEYKIENIDLIKPTIGNIEVPEGKANTKQIKVTGIEDKGGSGIKGYYVSTEPSFDGATWQTLNSDNFEFIATESKIYYVWVVDNAGNISEAKSKNITDIVDKVTKVEVPEIIELKVFEKATPTLTYSGEPESITWEIVDSSIATIDEKTGEITGVTSGETTAKVTLKDYDGTVTEREIKVIVKAIVPILEINEPKEFTFIYGDESSETTYTYDKNGELDILIDDENVVGAKIEGNKIIVTPEKVGTAIITIKTPEIPGYISVSRTINVTVLPKELKVSWSGDTFTYNGTEKKVEAIKQNIEEGDIVNVIHSGEKQTDAGNYEATIIGLDGADSKNYTIENLENATHNWVINKADREITIIPESVAVAFGTPEKIEVTYTGEDVETSLSGYDNSIIKVTLTDGVCSGEILVESIIAGEETITITVPESKNYNSITKDIKVISSLATSEIVVDSELILDYKVQKEITYTYGGDGNISVTIADPNILEVEHNSGDKKIKINPIKATEEWTTIKIKAEETEHYFETEATINVKVNKRLLEVKWSGDVFTYDGTEKKVEAIKQNSALGDIVNVIHSGDRYVDAGNYTATIIGLDGPDSENYTIDGLENISHNWVINKADRETNFPTDINLEYGNSGEVSYTYKGEDVSGDVEIRNENIAKITYEDLVNGGNITIIPVGSGETTVLIEIPESKNYNKASGEFNVKVNAADPKLELLDDPNLTFIYGGSKQDVTFRVVDGVGINVTTSDNTVATATRNGNKIEVVPHNVGVATITVSTVETPQYSTSTKTINVNVLARPVDINWGETVFFYDGTEKEVLATIANKVEGDTLTLEYKGNKATEVGTYEAEVISLSNNNYTLEGAKNIKTTWEIKKIEPPKIVVKQGNIIVPSGTWASGDVTIELTEINLESSSIGYEYSFDGSSWQTYTEIINYNSGETNGITIYARAYNKENGIAVTNSSEHILMIDKTDPEIKLESVNVTGMINRIINKDSKITIILNLEDNISGVKEGEFTSGDIKLIVNDEKEITDYNIESFTKISENKYEVVLRNINSNGKLSLKFNEKAVSDNATRYNKLTIIDLNLTLDNKGPEIGKIITSADEYGRVFTNTVDLEVTAKDESGIKSYEWQVSKDGITWETISKEETDSETSKITYDELDEGRYHFRVIVKDIMGNSSISEIASINVDVTINRKPTIRFETTQQTGTKVLIKAIIKSTKDIITIKVNGKEIEKSTWENKVIITNNEKTIEIEYEVTENGTYLWTVIDEEGNVVEETINITTIDSDAAEITYETFDATEYSNAKIVFKSNEDVRISKVIKKDGSTKIITNKKDFTGMEFSTIDFARKTTVEISGIDFEVGTKFVFENKSFIETTVEINKNITTKVIYVRTVSTGTKLFNELFTDEFTLDTAEMFVNQMISKTKMIGGKILSYYGMDSSSAKLKVGSTNQINAINHLSDAMNTGKVLRLDEYGKNKTLTPTVKRNNSLEDDGYRNKNITGVRPILQNSLGVTGVTEKNTFRIIIMPK